MLWESYYITNHVYISRLSTTITQYTKSYSGYLLLIQNNIWCMIFMKWIDDMRVGTPVPVHKSNWCVKSWGLFPTFWVKMFRECLAALYHTCITPTKLTKCLLLSPVFVPPPTQIPSSDQAYLEKESLISSIFKNSFIFGFEFKYKTKLPIDSNLIIHFIFTAQSYGQCHVGYCEAERKTERNLRCPLNR